MAAQKTMQRYRSRGGGAGLVGLEMQVPPEGGPAILNAAARLRERRRTAPADAISRLHDEAMARFAATCLWNVAPSKTPEGMRVIVDHLRRCGGMDAWRLASRIRDALDNAAR